MKKSNLLKVLNLVALSGGATYNLNTGETNPDHGYVVAIKGHELRTKILDQETLGTYVKENAYLLSKDNIYLGIWRDGNDYCIDCTQTIEDIEQAIEAGILNEQLAIWDSANKNEIRLPEPQRGGTETQRKTYASITARRLTHLNNC